MCLVQNIVNIRLVKTNGNNTNGSKSSFSCVEEEWVFVYFIFYYVVTSKFCLNRQYFSKTIEGNLFILTSIIFSLTAFIRTHWFSNRRTIFFWAMRLLASFLKFYYCWLNTAVTNCKQVWYYSYSYMLYVKCTQNWLIHCKLFWNKIRLSVKNLDHSSLLYLLVWGQIQFEWKGN